MDFSEVESHYSKWLLFDNDPHLIRTLYSLVLANRCDSDPVWALLIAPPSSGKTALLMSLTGSDRSVFVSTLTPYALASGFGDGSDSLLYQLDQNILIVEDMSAITELAPEARNTLFSFLRSAYNGSFVRAHGRGKIEWQGKFGMLGGATLAIESARRMEGSLGERFIYLRPKVNIQDQDAVLNRVLNQSGDRSKMRRILQNVAGTFLKQEFDFDKVKLEDSTLEIIKGSAIALCAMRTQAVRDSYSKDIEFPVEVSEMAPRLAIQLAAVAMASAVLKSTTEQTEQIVLRLMVDSMPYVKSKLLKAMHAGHHSMREIAANMKMSSKVLQRHLQELRHLDMVNMSRRREYSINNQMILHALDQL